MKNLSKMAGLVLFSLSILAGANEQGPHKGACKADIEKFCKDVKPGEGRIMACIEKNEANFSAECKTQMKEMHEHMPCAQDADKLCPGMKPGDGKFGKCMHEHEGQLSEKCKGFMMGMKAAHMREMHKEKHEEHKKGNSH